MKFVSPLVIMMMLCSCVNYSNNDEFSGNLQKLQNLKQIEGVYKDFELLHSSNTTSTSNWFSFSKNFIGIQSIKQESAMVRISYLSDDHLYFEVFSSDGRLLGDKHLYSPADFTFENGVIVGKYKKVSRYVIGYNEKLQILTLNNRGNLVRSEVEDHAGIIAAVFIPMPAVGRNTHYYEYERLK